MTSYRGSMFLGAALILGGAAGVNAADLYGGGGSVKHLRCSDAFARPVVLLPPRRYLFEL